MTLLVPNVAEQAILNKYLNQTFTLRLYCNDIIPSETDTAATYIEVGGGSYDYKSLIFSGWTISALGVATYAAQDFSFSGATNSPGEIYGYYVLDANSLIAWAERFAEAVIPFTPGAGSLIRINPRFVAS